MQIAFQTYLCYTCIDEEFLQIMEGLYGTEESDHGGCDLETAFDFLFSDCNRNVFSTDI